MRTKKTSVRDKLKNLAEEIIMRPVPDRGLLFHPNESKKNNGQAGKQVTFDELVKKKNELPEDIHVWSARNFVDYFAKEYQHYTGGNYRRVYKSDCIIIADIQRVLEDNGFDKFEDLKNLIEWGMLHKQHVLDQSKYLSIASLLQNINYFMQTRVKPKPSTDKKDESVLHVIEAQIKNTDPFELFETYGIPTMLTYFVKIKGYKQEMIADRLRSRLVDLKANNGRKRLANIARSSLNNSPYPAEFYGLNWRTDYADIMKSFKVEPWWQELDNPGDYSPTHLAFL